MTPAPAPLTTARRASNDKQRWWVLEGRLGARRSMVAGLWLGIGVGLSSASTPGKASPTVVPKRTPSVGCGFRVRPEVIEVPGKYIVTFPPGYDGLEPTPVIFGFHGIRRTHEQFREVDARTLDSILEASYIMAYPKATGDGWAEALDDNIARFDSLYESLLNNHCIDTGRVFAVGQSAGAVFAMRLACRRRLLLRAIAPVAASGFEDTCSPIPVLAMHGTHDRVRGNDGSDYVSKYRQWNGCVLSRRQYDVQSCRSWNTTSEFKVTPGCTEYLGCGDDRTIWCSHNDPNYDYTSHGWPCFANQTIFDFFATFDDRPDQQSRPAASSNTPRP